MAQIRIRSDGVKTVANTIYLPEKTDNKAKDKAKLRSQKEKRLISKSAIIVETIEQNL